jgi:hypothetical protein
LFARDLDRSIARFDAGGGGRCGFVCPSGGRRAAAATVAQVDVAAIASGSDASDGVHEGAVTIGSTTTIANEFKRNMQLFVGQIAHAIRQVRGDVQLQVPNIHIDDPDAVTEYYEGQFSWCHTVRFGLVNYMPGPAMDWRRAPPTWAMGGVSTDFFTCACVC